MTTKRNPSPHAYNSDDAISRYAFNEYLYLPAQRRRTILVAVWPCGSRWTIEKGAGSNPWNCPRFENSGQAGTTTVTSTRRELSAYLAGYGVRFERVDAEEESRRIWS